MSQRAFIDMIRQFSSAAQRKHRSFAIGVNAALQCWRETVMASDVDEAEKAREIAWANYFVMREYVKNDTSYVLPAGN